MNREKMAKIFSENKNIKPLYIILITGVVILFFSNFISCTDKKETAAVQSSVGMPTKELAHELEKILSEIKGAGKVKVMITYEGTGEKYLAADVTNEQSQNGAGGNNGNMNTHLQSKQTSKVFAPDDAAVVTKESFPEVRGVIVVCDGGGEVSVKASIIDAVRAVLSVAEHKISVFEKK